MSDEPTTRERVTGGVSHAVGRSVIGPAIAGALDSPDTQTAVRNIAWTVGIAIGACVAAGIVAGVTLAPRKDRDR